MIRYISFSLISLAVLLGAFPYALAPPALGDDGKPPAGDTSAKTAPTEMNGYTLKQFGDFVHKWHFVTVRFRRDNGEMRFVYANDIAWKALNQHSKDYPDGAVFAKVAVMTQEDPAFVDSSVPSGTRRIQFMVRDHKQHNDTDGWGYELFLGDKGVVRLTETLKDTVDACNACHLAVPDRGMVFSEPMVPLLGPVPTTASPKPDSLVSFITVDVAALPDYVREKVPQEFKQVRQMEGPPTRHIFPGSLTESLPLVAAEAARAGMPAALIGQNGPGFSLLWPVQGEKAKCILPGGQEGRSVTGGLTMARIGPPSQGIYGLREIRPFCVPADAAPRKDQ